MPATQKAHSESATSIWIVWVTNRTLLRENRSASRPDTGPTSSDGKKPTKAARPSQNFELSVSS